MIATIRRVIGTCLLVLLVACNDRAAVDTPAQPGNRFVVVYSPIDEARTAALYRAFTAETGIRVQQVSADKSRLLQLMLDKTQAPAADLFMATGVSQLWRAADQGVLRPTHADELTAAIPARLRDPENQWFGFAVLANVIVFNRSLARPEEFVSYESLAEPAWRGRICMTSSSQPDNSALIALLIQRHGHRQAELVVRQLVANLALPPLTDPQALLAAIESGRCPVGIVTLEAAVNRMAVDPGSKLGVATPTLESGATQVDIVGAGVTRHAGNATDAISLIRWLAKPLAQGLIAESFTALPAVRDAAVPQRLRPWQDLKQSDTGVFHLGLLHQDAIDLAERAKYR